MSMGSGKSSNGSLTIPERHSPLYSQPTQDQTNQFSQGITPANNAGGQPNTLAQFAPGAGASATDLTGQNYNPGGGLTTNAPPQLQMASGGIATGPNPTGGQAGPNPTGTQPNPDMLQVDPTTYNIGGGAPFTYTLGTGGPSQGAPPNFSAAQTPTPQPAAAPSESHSDLMRRLGLTQGGGTAYTPPGAPAMPPQAPIATPKPQLPAFAQPQPKAGQPLVKQAYGHDMFGEPFLSPPRGLPGPGSAGGPLGPGSSLSPATGPQLTRPPAGARPDYSGPVMQSIQPATPKPQLPAFAQPTMTGGQSQAPYTINPTRPQYNSPAITQPRLNQLPQLPATQPAVNPGYTGGGINTGPTPTGLGSINTAERPGMVMNNNTVGTSKVSKPTLYQAGQSSPLGSINQRTGPAKPVPGKVNTAPMRR